MLVYDAELIRELLKLSGEKVRSRGHSAPRAVSDTRATVQQQHVRVVLPKGTLDRVFAAVEVEVRRGEHVETLLLEHRSQRLVTCMVTVDQLHYWIIPHCSPVDWIACRLYASAVVLSGTKGSNCHVSLSVSFTKIKKYVITVTNCDTLQSNPQQLKV